MKILDLTEETKNDYFACLEEWSDEIKDGVCRKSNKSQKPTDEVRQALCSIAKLVPRYDGLVPLFHS